MSPDAFLRCSVVAALPGFEWSVELSLPAGATLGDALALARHDYQRLPVVQQMAINWQGAAIGVWGEVRSRDAPLCEGDRIEIYRPLSLDPKQGRRQRAQSRRS
jgi:putative ubiquitin-RnfH superfamily antitoxin RatB of RatAB toxin-antitoxin module